MNDFTELNHATPAGVRVYHNQPFLPAYSRRWANPSPLAFSCMASGLYIVSTVLLSVDGQKSLGIVPAIAIGYSAAGMLIAGLAEFPTGNTWGATVYIALAGFWASLGMILSGSFGVVSSYGDDTAQLNAALGQYFFSWMITAMTFTLAAFRSSGGLLVFLVLLDLTLLSLAMAYHNGGPVWSKLGGSFGMAGAAVAWYATVASLITKESFGFNLPVLGDMNPSHRE